MNYCEKIPVKTKGYALNGNDVFIDTAGLEATLYADGADVYIKANSEVTNEDAFILKDGAVERGITEEMLLKEAQGALKSGKYTKSVWAHGPIWACGGATVTALVWILSVIW